MLNYDDENHKLFVSFIGATNKRNVGEKLATVCDYQILNVFDPMIKECNDILQLLYEDYVLNY